MAQTDGRSRRAAGPRTDVAGGELPGDAGRPQYFRDSSEDYSLSLFVNDTILASVSGGVGPASISGASTFPPGAYPASLIVAQATTQPFSAALSLSCCDAEISAGGDDTNSEGAILIVLTISGDGECSLPEKDSP